jgi:hypothetical protein
MRKIILIIVCAAIVALLCYVFIWPYEFEVKLKARTSPGDVIETIRIWNRSLDEATIIKVDSLSRLEQTINKNNRSYHFNWNFTERDSLTKISVRISEPARSIWNKLLVPFTTQPIEQDASELLHEFNDAIQEHLKITSVRIIGEAQLDESFCVCSSIEANQIEKANGMMQHFIPLTTFVSEFALKPEGPPLIRVQQWSHTAGKLKFDFCFPIVLQDTLPEPSIFTYKKFGKLRVLKAEYHGNYITSDRAWYDLIRHAQENGFKVKGLPIEYFHNNPNLGGKEWEWKADIFLPIE